MESLPTSREIVRIIYVDSPRPISLSITCCIKREESEVADRHVCVLGAEQKLSHDLHLRVTVHDHCVTSHIAPLHSRGERQEDSIAPNCEKLTSKAMSYGSYSFYTAVQINHTCLHLVSVHQTALPLTNSNTSHMIAAYYSFIDLKRMKGYVGLVG